MRDYSFMYFSCLCSGALVQYPVSCCGTRNCVGVQIIACPDGRDVLRANDAHKTLYSPHSCDTAAQAYFMPNHFEMRNIHHHHNRHPQCLRHHHKTKIPFHQHADNTDICAYAYSHLYTAYYCCASAVLCIRSVCLQKYTMYIVYISVCFKCMRTHPSHSIFPLVSAVIIFPSVV